VLCAPRIRSEDSDRALTSEGSCPRSRLAPTKAELSAPSQAAPSARKCPQATPSALRLRSALSASASAQLPSHRAQHPQKLSGSALWQDQRKPIPAQPEQNICPQIELDPYPQQPAVERVPRPGHPSPPRGLFCHSCWSPPAMSKMARSEHSCAGTPKNSRCVVYSRLRRARQPLT